MVRPMDIAREMDYRDGGSASQVIRRLEKDKKNQIKIENYDLKISRIGVDPTSLLNGAMALAPKA